MPRTKQDKKKAFSMIELSIVIMIIGVIIAAVFQGIKLIHKAQMRTAHQLTQSAPVNSIEDLSLWYETSSPKSLTSTEAVDEEALSTWNDLNVMLQSKSNASQSSADYKPQYLTSEIHGLDAISFDGVDDYFEFDGSFLNGTNYTIMVVEKRASATDDSYFLGDSSVDSENENILLGYKDSSTLTHSHTGTNYYDFPIEEYATSENEARIFSFLHGSSGNKTWLNGGLQDEDDDTSHLSNVSTVRIGNEYSGSIGEIVIFTRALKNKERKDVEDYLGQKWDIPVNHSEVLAARDGCTVSATGITSTDVDHGDASSITCDSGYSGSIAYDCDDGDAQQSGSCTALSGCTVSATGITSTDVDHGDASSITCGSGYSGSIAYDCDDGDAQQSGSCTALAGCTISATGITSTNVAHGASGSITCNAPGHAGQVDYSCNDGTDTQTSSCSVAVGCTIIANGIDETAVDHGSSGSVSCNGPQHTGSVAYSCDNGTDTQTSSCTVVPGCYVDDTQWVELALDDAERMVPVGDTKNYSCEGGNISYYCHSNGADALHSSSSCGDSDTADL